MNLTEVDFEDIKKENPDMTEGGSWQPRDCIPDGTLAIVVPLRGREQHFKILLRNLIPFLKLQKKAFTMFAIEQVRTSINSLKPLSLLLSLPVIILYTTFSMLLSMIAKKEQQYAHN